MITPGLVYTGSRFLVGEEAEVTGEADRRITTGDHVHLSLPFTNNGSATIADANIEVVGAPHSATTPGTQIYDGSAWRSSAASASLSLVTINPGETRWLDFWIYVVDSDPTLRQSLSGETWINVESLTGSWRIGIILSPISFTDVVIGNDDMEAGSCLHSPQNPSIQQYAQYAAGACPKSDRTSVSEECKPRIPPDQCDPEAPGCDPDTPEQAVRNLVDRVRAEFNHSELYSMRQVDVRLLGGRGGDIGVCRDYADLTTSLLRSLDLPARTVTAILKNEDWYAQQEKQPASGHNWTEAYIGSEKPFWKQADSTWNKAINQQSAYEDDDRFSKVQEAWADKYPLSSASPWNNKEYRCIAPCYESPIDCIACQHESNTSKSALFPDLSCVENVQSDYHNSGASTAFASSTTGGLLLNLESPTNVTQGVPFAIATGVTNDTLTPLSVITMTIGRTEYVDSTVQLFEVALQDQVLNNVGAGDTITVTWTITPLVTGSGIPLRSFAESGDLFEFDEQPLVANEPGTRPDLSLTGVCGLGNASPGQEVTLTANMLDEYLQAFSDMATVVTATVVSTPTLGFSTTLTLPYCESCGAYQGTFTLPDTSPVGDYVVNLEAAHPNYDPGYATSAFFVIPSLAVSLSTDQSVLGVLDTITVTAQVLDRDATVSGAAVSVEIITPGGTVTAPLTFDAEEGNYLLALHPADLAGNLGGEVLAGTWQAQASASFQGGIGSDDASFTVVGTYPLSEVTATRSETGARLTWPHMGSGVDHYEIYRSITPYFIPGAADSVKLDPDVAPALAAGDELSLTDEAAFVEAGASYFYVVRPVDANGQLYRSSNRVGVFNFALTAGTP